MTLFLHNLVPAQAVMEAQMPTRHRCEEEKEGQEEEANGDKLEQVIRQASPPTAARRRGVLGSRRVGSH